MLSGYPEHVVLGDNITVILTCATDDDYKIVAWVKDAIKITDIKDDYVFIGIPDDTYNYTLLTVVMCLLLTVVVCPLLTVVMYPLLTVAMYPLLTVVMCPLLRVVM